MISYYFRSFVHALKNTLSGGMTKMRAFAGKIKEDVKNFDMNNTDEMKVLNSYYFSAYKGRFVLRTGLSRSGSFGILFISRKANDRPAAEDVIRHEYGHAIQLKQIGFFSYLFRIFIPSVFEMGDDPVYYRRPWEITADIYGGVRSRSYPEYESAGLSYLENCKSKKKRTI